ncbi:hypothetical protein NQZ68_023717 [Dissostichus eleginoides]|nr:hypothetical protein NQZ68_023717 [Dissostichus eleginoides]
MNLHFGMRHSLSYTRGKRVQQRRSERAPPFTDIQLQERKVETTTLLLQPADPPPPEGESDSNNTEEGEGSHD